MGGFHDPNSEILAETYSDSPVTGLSVGSPVNLFGVKVGEVREISFATAVYDNVTTDDFGRVCIVMAISKKRTGHDKISDYKIREFISARTQTGLRAVITSNGITGLSRVDLKYVENENPPEVPRWKPRYPLVPPSPSLMDNLTVAATKVMNKLKTIDLDEAWSNVNRLVNSTAHVAESIDGMVESRRACIHQIFGDVSEMAATLKETAAMLRDNPSLLIRPTDHERLPETER